MTLKERLNKNVVDGPVTPPSRDGFYVWFQRNGWLKWLPNQNYWNEKWDTLEPDMDKWGNVYEIVTNGKEIKFITA